MSIKAMDGQVWIESNKAMDNRKRRMLTCTIDRTLIKLSRRDFAAAVGAAVVTGKIEAEICIKGGVTHFSPLAVSRVVFTATRRGQYIAGAGEMLVQGNGMAEWCNLYLPSRAYGFNFGEGVRLSDRALSYGDVIAWNELVLTVEP